MVSGQRRSLLKINFRSENPEPTYDLRSEESPTNQEKCVHRTRIPRSGKHEVAYDGPDSLYIHLILIMLQPKYSINPT